MSVYISTKQLLLTEYASMVVGYCAYITTIETPQQNDYIVIYVSLGIVFEIT